MELITRGSNTTCHGMTVAMGHSLGDNASSGDGEDGDDDDDTENEPGQLSQYGEPSWVIGTITKMVQQHMDRFRQRQMKLDELTQQGLEESADYFHERDEKYSTSELRFLTVVNI
jgi:hypothetical protein